MKQSASARFAMAWLFPWLMLPGFFAELGLALWLLVRGVDASMWQERLGERAVR